MSAIANYLQLLRDGAYAAELCLIVVVALGVAVILLHRSIRDLHRKMDWLCSQVNVLARGAAWYPCDGVWHHTSPREPACPKCGERELKIGT